MVDVLIHLEPIYRYWKPQDHRSELGVIIIIIIIKRFV